VSYGKDLVDRMANSLQDALNKPSMIVKSYPHPLSVGGYPYASIRLATRRPPARPFDMDDVSFTRDIIVRVVTQHYMASGDWQGVGAEDAYGYLEDMEVYFHSVTGGQLINEIDTTGPDYLSPIGLIWVTDTGWRSFEHPYIQAVQWGFEVTFQAGFYKPVT
jgi:hypothetical protein